MSCSSYIKPQRTSTWTMQSSSCMSCSSYIKPQHDNGKIHNFQVVCLVLPTSNHNQINDVFNTADVVCLVLPTSNHNTVDVCPYYEALYVLFFLHQTTTKQNNIKLCHKLYVLFFLHQTTTMPVPSFARVALYVLFFLHQTTTCQTQGLSLSRCMSCSSYIKPQPLTRHFHSTSVVCLVLPTSNHNLGLPVCVDGKLYVLFFLHQTTT